MHLEQKPSPSDLLAADAHLIHPLTQPTAHAESGPLIYESGEGAEVTLVGGRRAIDATSGLWCVNVGHGRQRIGEIASAQISTLAFAPTFAGAASIPAIELAERLAQLTPGDLTATMFTSGGSEANESAIKLARLHWRLRGAENKTIVLSHERAYHGLTIATSTATALEPYRRDFGPLAPDIQQVRAPYVYRCECVHGEDCDPETCPVMTGQALEERIEELGSERVAAVILEPVIGTGGVIVPPPGYLRAVREVCTRQGVLMIADEVITGFGRTGTMFGVDREQVVPDMMTFAKGLTSGYLPLGAVVLAEAVWDVLRSMPRDRALMHGFTYSGHPVACAVGLENLRVLEEEQLVARVASMGELLGELLAPLRDLPHVGEVRQIGLMAGIELVADRPSKARFAPTEGVGGAVMMAARERGVLVRALIDDVIMMAPPFVIEESQLRDVVAAVAEGIETVTGPGRTA